jgi:hypothetical protein
MPDLKGKTTDPDPRLPGTIHTAAREIAAAGGRTGARALPLVCDIRDEAAVRDAVAAHCDRDGGHRDETRSAAAAGSVPYRLNSSSVGVVSTTRGASLPGELSGRATDAASGLRPRRLRLPRPRF